MQRWEYTSMQIVSEPDGTYANDSDGGSMKVDNVDRHLNATFGNAGWELAAVNTVGRGEWFYFKRPIED